MDFEWADIGLFTMAAAVLVIITIVSVVVVGELLGSGVEVLGAPAIMGVLTALAVLFVGMFKDRRTANMERMIKAMYDHFKLGGGGPAGRVGGGSGNDRGQAGADRGGDTAGAARGTDDEGGRDGRSDTNAP